VIFAATSVTVMGCYFPCSQGSGKGIATKKRKKRLFPYNL